MPPEGRSPLTGAAEEVAPGRGLGQLRVGDDLVLPPELLRLLVQAVGDVPRQEAGLAAALVAVRDLYQLVGGHLRVALVTILADLLRERGDPLPRVLHPLPLRRPGALLGGLVVVAVLLQP